MTLCFYNTLTRSMQPFQPADPEHVKLYVCGPTVYDDAHLGHARCYITWDVLFRLFRHVYGPTHITYVRNVTDVDDKILNRAQQQDTTPQAIAETYYQRFNQDMAALNVLPPTHEPKATEHIQAMLSGIQAMLKAGAAYATPDGSVYFRTAAKPDYGKLSQKNLDDLQAGARVEVDPDKESPLDFALWKAVSPDDTRLSWPSTGLSNNADVKGRPGWHIECSAMIRQTLGEQIDVHAGGADLVFPHHENEIAQSEVWTGKTPFVRVWLHNGFVNVSGQKMSKSLDNFATVRTVLQHYNALTLRYFLLSHHYRSPVDFNDEALQGAKNWVSKTQRQLRQLLKTQSLSASAFCSTEAMHALLQHVSPDVLAALANDMDTPRALALLNAQLDALTPENMSESLSDNLSTCLATFALLGFNLTELLTQDDLPAEYTQKMVARSQAKADKNWAEADRLRQELLQAGVALMDRKDGTTDWEWL